MLLGAKIRKIQIKRGSASRLSLPLWMHSVIGIERKKYNFWRVVIEPIEGEEAVKIRKATARELRYYESGFATFADGTLAEVDFSEEERQSFDDEWIEFKKEQSEWEQITLEEELRQNRAARLAVTLATANKARAKDAKKARQEEFKSYPEEITIEFLYTQGMQRSAAYTKLKKAVAEGLIKITRTEKRGGRGRPTTIYKNLQHQSQRSK